MLTLTDLSKSFPQRGLVLNKLNLEVRKGETLAITGPSGSGKTTLLNMIGLLDRPDSGSIIFDGAELAGLDINQSADYRRDQVGFVFQEHLLLPHLTILENIYLPLLAIKKYPENIKEIESYVDQLMDRTGIHEIASKYPHQVSGGEAQRGTLVRALINKPGLLLADEPTGSLDNENSDILGDLLNELNKELDLTILAVTHSDGFASKMKRQLKLNNGVLS